MTGLHEVACGACGRRHVMSAARAREQRVLRCECGQFVRLDRALTDGQSDPAPAPLPVATPARNIPDAFDNDDEDEATHMFASLDDVAAQGATRGNSEPGVKLSAAAPRATPQRSSPYSSAPAGS